MFRARLLTMEPYEDSLLDTMKDCEIFREAVPGCSAGFQEYDYYCSDEQGLMNMINEHWQEDPALIERISEPPDQGLAADTAESMLTEAEVHVVPGELTPAEVFDRWCDWQGLIHWGPRLRGAMANLLGREEL